MSRTRPPLNDAQAGPDVQFVEIMRDQLAGSGMLSSTYVDRAS